MKLRYFCKWEIETCNFRIQLGFSLNTSQVFFLVSDFYLKCTCWVWQVYSPPIFQIFCIAVTHKILLCKDGLLSCCGSGPADQWLIHHFCLQPVCLSYTFINIATIFHPGNPAFHCWALSAARQSLSPWLLHLWVGISSFQCAPWNYNEHPLRLDVQYFLWSVY